MMHAPLRPFVILNFIRDNAQPSRVMLKQVQYDEDFV